MILKQNSKIISTYEFVFDLIAMHGSHVVRPSLRWVRPVLILPTREQGASMRAHELSVFSFQGIAGQAVDLAIQVKNHGVANHSRCV